MIREAGTTGLEPAISALTGQYVNRYTTSPLDVGKDIIRPQQCQGSLQRKYGESSKIEFKLTKRSARRRPF